MRKRVWAMVLAVAMVLSLMVVPVRAESDATDEAAEETVTFAGGDGTEDNPYQVATAEQLDAVRNDLSAYYIQTADIDLTGIEWIPIGTYFDDAFSGQYDGNGYQISNLIISENSVAIWGADSNYETSLFCGLFGVSEGTINNVSLLGCSINIIDSNLIEVYGGNFDHAYYGSIVAVNLGNIKDCTSYGEMYLSSAADIIFVGGIVGYNGESCQLSKNFINIEINKESASICYCGGVSGNSSVSIKNSINYGSISACGENEYLWCGGICGDGSAETCINYGNIETILTSTATGYGLGPALAIGGIVGLASNDIVDCINCGEVSGRTELMYYPYVGGIVGFVSSYKTPDISNCYNLAARIDAESGYGNEYVYVGRIFGVDYAKISECYSIDTTTLNGEIPDESETGATTMNGASLTEDEITAAIASILAELGIEGNNSGADDDSNAGEATSSFLTLNVDTNTFRHTWTSFYGDYYIVIKTLDEDDSWVKADLSIQNNGAEVVEDDELFDTIESIYVENTATCYRRVDTTYYDCLTHYYVVSTEQIDYQTSYGRILLANCEDETDRANMRMQMSSVWDGACLGISTSIILAANDAFDLCGGTNYSDLGTPAENSALRDEIHYYQLLQYCSDYETDQSVDNSGLRKGSKLKTFLTALVAEAQQCQTDKIAFLLNYCYKKGEGSTGGHTVVVCGYNSGSFEVEGTTYTHKIIIYDPNDKSNEYRYFYVTDNCSAFSFRDSNHSNASNINEVWTMLSFVGIDSIQSAFYASPATAATAVDADASADSDDATQTKLYISGYQTFTLTNAEGETLYYDGENYDGSMEIYDVSYYFNETENGEDSSVGLRLIVDSSESYTLTSYQDGFEIAVGIDSVYYAASAAGADTICLSSSDGVVIEGDSEYTFAAAISTDLDSCEQVRISGTTSGTTQLTVDEDGAVLTTENDCTGTTVETYIGTDYEVETIDGTTVKVAISDDSNGETNVEVTEGATNPFTDVNTDHYFYNAVLWAIENGITSGTSDTTFSPFQTAERCQVVTFLWRAAGCPEVAEGTENPFTDVSESDYFYTAVLWAVQEGITSGTSATTFSPFAKCERCQVVTFLYRYFDEPEVTTTENPFTDVDTDDYFYNAVLWAVDNGITTGTSDTTFGPFVTCERCMVVTFLYRALVE